MTTTQCPTPNRLAAFYDGSLPTEDHLRVARHIRYCPACQQKSAAQGMPIPPSWSFPESNTSGNGPRTGDVPETVVALDRIGPYQIRKLIGRGGMGAVYDALHVRLGKPVALKVLPRTAAIDPEQLKRFEREVLAVGKLDHPNVVRATDAGDQDGVPYLAMELVDGVDLARAVLTLGPLPVADACEVVRQAAAGLAHAHQKGIVHRDVKPSNLMITADGVVKVLDLGLAVFVTPVGRVDERITGGSLLGTYDYMAPEQWSDPSAVTDKADVYALGCLLFQALIGRPPFAGEDHDSPHAKRKAHLNTPSPLLTTLRPEVSADLAELVRKMTAKQAADRPTAAAAADALGRLIPATPPLSRLVNRTRQAPDGEFSDGRPTAVAPAQPATGIAPPTVVAADPTSRFTQHGVRPADADPTLVRPWEVIAAVVLLVLVAVGILAVIWEGAQ